MRLFIVDAFTETPGGGNQAGVALAESSLPPEEDMRATAAQLGFSETAFVLREGAGFRLRYFTPVEEVPLCGHATVAAFTVLRREGLIDCGDVEALTQSGPINVTVAPDCVWMDMAAPVIVRDFSPEEAAEIYAACGVESAGRHASLRPRAVSTGLADIMLPLSDTAALNAARPDMGAVSALSERYGVVGVHMFAPGEAGTMAHARNLAPLYGIDEECATGTSNGALTWYLHCAGRAVSGGANRVVQGESMGRPSVIFTSLSFRDGAPLIRVGGPARVR